MSKYTRFSYAQQLFLIYVSLGDRPRPVRDEAALELEHFKIKRGYHSFGRLQSVETSFPSTAPYNCRCMDPRMHSLEGSVTKPSDRRNLKFEFKFHKFQVNFSKFQISA